MGDVESKEARLKSVELRLNEKQKLFVLLYLARAIPAARLLAALEGCEEMSLLRLEEAKSG